MNREAFGPDLISPGGGSNRYAGVHPLSTKVEWTTGLLTARLKSVI